MGVYCKLMATKEGELSIKKKTFVVTLKNSVLSWSTKAKDKLVGTISIVDSLTDAEKVNDTTFIVGPDGKGSYYEFTTEAKQVDEWIKAINDAKADSIPKAEEGIPDMEVSSDKSKKQGWMKYKTKLRFYDLKEGVLVWYAQEQTDMVKMSTNFKGQIILSGCTVEKGDKPNTLVLTDGKGKHIFATPLASQVDPWIAALKSGIEIANTSGVGDSKGKKREQLSVGAKIKKGLAQKIGTSKGGKKMVKNLFNSEVMELLSSLNKVITAYSTPKKAEEIENNIIKIITKIYFLIEGEKVGLEEFLKADKPLRQGLKTLSNAWGNWNANRRQKKGWLETAFAAVNKNFKEVEKVLVRLTTPFLRPKNIVRIQYTLAFLSNMEFLKFVAKNDKLEDDRLELELAMDNYTAIEINLE